MTHRTPIEIARKPRSARSWEATKVLPARHVQRPLPATRKAQKPFGLGVATSGPQLFQDIRHSLGLTQQEMCSLTGISIRKISALETGEQKPAREDLRRYNELRRLREHLARIGNPEDIGAWLQSPSDYFNGASPLQIIERGESDRLWRLIWRLQDGVPLD